MCPKSLCKVEEHIRKNFQIKGFHADNKEIYERCKLVLNL